MKKNHELEGKFNPKDFEEKIYKEWEEKEYFKPSEDKTKEAYTIVIPPPNITILPSLIAAKALSGSISSIVLTDNPV